MHICMPVSDRSIYWYIPGIAYSNKTLLFLVKKMINFFLYIHVIYYSIDIRNTFLLNVIFNMNNIMFENAKTYVKYKTLWLYALQYHKILFMKKSIGNLWKTYRFMYIIVSYMWCDSCITIDFFWDRFIITAVLFFLNFIFLII